VIELLARHARLADKLPHTPLGQFPTPVERLDKFGAAIGAPHLYIKRDDLSGELYGGNKVRKLEFLLAEAVRSGAREVMTFGFAGSNHATATAVYARRVGLKSISLLIPQPSAEYVRRNLLVSHAAGAELHHYPHAALLGWGAAYERWRHRRRTGVHPFVIAPGGTSPLGNVGYVNAAFELQAQVEAGLLPEPDVIYVASGTMGTAAGLMLGLGAAGMKTRVVAVRVVDEKFTSAARLVRLFNQTSRLLHAADPDFQPLALIESEVSLRHEFYGAGYGIATESGQSAARLLAETEGLELDGTYTGKTLAALVTDARRGDWRSRVALFWNTYNSRDCAPLTAGSDYRRLPRAFHGYFE
jgi:1-aminocyclopropane-1-carboxylate deaminase/D-cysteine desulfhydrase-like pyridoxal-dependent ACC family enzyme